MSEKSKKPAENITRNDCSHYKRNCAFISPCCKKIYVCRLCHNEKEKHEINRHAVQQIKCLQCSTIQSVAKECTNCGVCFGKYFCDICRLYDEEKDQFHCTSCGICRVGGRENFFHCERCNSCLSLKLRDAHKCVENASHANCPVCLEDLHTSRNTVEVPRCGHYIHQTCFKDMMKHGTFACPLCGESYRDMKMLWEFIDEEVRNTQMPEEYKNFKVTVLCKDCHKESQVLFHVIGLKCNNCGSYNTCRAAGGDEAPTTSTPETSDTAPDAEAEDTAEDLLHV